jgi:DNA repair protein RadD
MTSLRDYQLRAVGEVESSPSRRVCLVMPTGAGKTVVLEELSQRALDRAERVLVLVHREELLHQTVERLAARLGKLAVGCISPDAPPSPHAPVQVAMIQTIVRRTQRPRADLVLWDECHHALADSWQAILEDYADAKLVGLTATPQRLDGRPLGDIFEELIVGARYPDLLQRSYLVDCKAYQPPEVPGSGLARDPLDAWQRYGDGRQTIGFAGSVPLAAEYAARFTAAGIPSALVDADTPKLQRKATLKAFREGRIKVLWNVYVLTEGTDIPSTACILLARNCAHVSMYLQIVGRGLRPHESKRDCVLIDLSGATLIHGLPLEDRVYSLGGKAIQRTSLEPLKNCQQCGATILSAYQVCPECGYEFPRVKREGPRIYDMDLVAVFAGSATPEDAKQREFRRLLGLCETKGWSLWFACREFEKLFGRQPAPEIRALPRDKQRELFTKIRAGMEAKGKSVNQARGAWKHMAGAWPDWSWR